MSEDAKDGVVTCKIMNYSKFLYNQEKRAKANKKVKQETKEIRLSDTIADNDLKTKAKQADKFMKDGNKVQVTIPYKGRQMAYINHGKEVMKHFQEFLTCEYKIIKPVKIEGNNVFMMIEATKK